MGRVCYKIVRLGLETDPAKGLSYQVIGLTIGLLIEQLDQYI